MLGGDWLRAHPGVHTCRKHGFPHKLPTRRANDRSVGLAPKAGDNVPVPLRPFSEPGEEIDTAVFEQRAERIREHN